MVGIAILKLSDVPIVKFVNSNLVGIRKFQRKEFRLIGQNTNKEFDKMQGGCS